MRKRIFNWQEQRFIYLNIEGEPGESLHAQSRMLFQCAASQLAAHKLSLDRHTVRTRIFGRTAEARIAGSEARAQALTGTGRASGSSYISPRYFSSDADVALDLYAMASPPDGAVRKVTEHEPPQSFIRHLVWADMVFLAGLTCEQGNFQQQLDDILARGGALLVECGCRWSDVVRMSVFLHKSVDPETLLAGIDAAASPALKVAEIETVEGFSRPHKLLEIEITART